MENMINGDMMDRVVERPKVADQWGEFPYGEVLSTLMLLDSTKSMKFTVKEMPKNRIGYLKSKAKLKGVRLRCATKNGVVYLWAVRGVG